jgi:hypothetical protein
VFLTKPDRDYMSPDQQYLFVKSFTVCTLTGYMFLPRFAPFLTELQESDGLYPTG